MTSHNDGSAERAAKYGKLPPVIRIEDTSTSQETAPTPDPEGGRDTNRDFITRYS